MIPDLDLALLKTFAAIVDEGGLTAAGQITCAPCPRTGRINKSRPSSGPLPDGYPVVHRAIAEAVRDPLPCNLGSQKLGLGHARVLRVLPRQK